jgi:hypothetical protein
MTSTLMLFAEILVAVLLVATVVTSIRLSRRITRMQGDETAMRATVVELMKATETAERAIAGLRTTLGDCEKTLGDRLRVAERYASDLAEQVEAGENVMNRMMSMVDSSRQAMNQQIVSEPQVMGTQQVMSAPQPSQPQQAAPAMREAPRPPLHFIAQPAPQPVAQMPAQAHAPQRLVSDRISEAAEMLAQRAMRRAAPQGNTA